MAGGAGELSFWHDTLPEPVRPRDPLQGDHRADVAIVGAGYTGLWTAWYLRRLEPTLELALVEAETAGFGASGRNGGWCSAFLSGSGGWLDDPARRDGAIRLQRQMFATVADVGREAAAAGIDCHYERSGALEVAVNGPQLRRLRTERDQALELGFDDSDYRWLDREQARQALRVEGALGALHIPHCAAIHPARLARGLADTLASQGVALYEGSPVREVAAGLVRTEHGSVRADTVILATEGYSGRVRGHARRVVPVHSTMVATEPLDAGLLAQLDDGRRYCFGNLDHVVTYGQRTADNRIAFGCRGLYYFGSGIRDRFGPDDPVFDRVRQTLLRFFPPLRDVRFTHAWGGALGVCRALRPAVCFDRRRRIGWAGGYFGNGVAAAHLAGRTLADLVLGRDSERVHTPWVNPPEAARLWEPEPLRWLGFHGMRSLMERADRAEYRGRSAARLERLIDRIL